MKEKQTVTVTNAEGLIKWIKADKAKLQAELDALKKERAELIEHMKMIVAVRGHFKAPADQEAKRVVTRLLKRLGVKEA